MARFKVENIIYLDSVKSIFIIGIITEGQITLGMMIKSIGMSVKINGIESADGELNNKPVSKIALKLSEDSDVFEKLQNEIILGSEIIIGG